jgi:glycine C-acetyltransferase
MNFSTYRSIYDYYNSVSRGIEEFCGYKGRVDIINSTLGKALGGAAGINNCKHIKLIMLRMVTQFNFVLYFPGGYTTGSKELIALLRQKSRPYLFSNTLPPPVVAGASKVRI